MKKNELTQIKGLSLKELSDKVKTIRKEIEEKVLDKNMKKLKDLKTVSKKRKDLAQVLTIIRQKQLLAELESEASIKSSEKKGSTGQSMQLDNEVDNGPELKKGGRTELSKTK